VLVKVLLLAAASWILAGCSSGATSSSSGCVPTPVPHEAAQLPLNTQLVPGDYEITAISTEGQRVRGRLRLWKTSSADSGFSRSREKWVRVAPDDTILHPLIGVTNVRFMRTLLDTDSTLDQRERATNPLYPQVVVLQLADPSTQRKRIEVLVETVHQRHPQSASLDGAGSGLRVAAIDGDTFRAGRSVGDPE